jgi:hypothetical protein
MERSEKRTDDSRDAVKTTRAGEMAAATGGNAILNTIGTMHIEPTSNEAAEAIANLSVEMVREILANRDLADPNQRVIITFQDSVMQDTKAVISRDGKTISVTFMTGSGESADIINMRSGELRSQLMEKLPMTDDVKVEVEHTPREEGRRGGGDGSGDGRNQRQRDDDTAEDDGRG